MVHRWAAQSWNSGPRAQKQGTGLGHVTKLGHAPEGLEDGEEMGKGLWKLPPFDSPFSPSGHLFLPPPPFLLYPTL